MKSMKIEVKLVGVFRIDRFAQKVLEYPAGATVQDVVQHLGLPEHLLGIVIVNDRHATVEHLLQDGDSLMLLPLLGGG
jgi:sulfur-carrier protein